MQGWIVDLLGMISEAEIRPLYGEHYRALQFECDRGVYTVGYDLALTYPAACALAAPRLAASCELLVTRVQSLEETVRQARAHLQYLRQMQDAYRQEVYREASLVLAKRGGSQ